MFEGINLNWDTHASGLRARGIDLLKLYVSECGNGGNESLQALDAERAERYASKE